MINIFDSEGNLINSFGKLHDYGNPELTYWGNSIDITIDSNDNILVTFAEQNRIEKYTPEGELIFRADRLLNYKLDYKDATINREIEEIPRSLTYKDLTNVSSAIGTDHKGRIWVKTYKKQKEENDEAWDYLEFELYDKRGVLLTKVPVPQEGSTYFSGDRIYFVLKGEMCVYEYKIVEK